MNKKRNTFLFILGGTVFNVLITFIYMFVLIFIYLNVFIEILPEATQAWFIPVVFGLAILLSFLTYRWVVKLISQKIDMDKYFDPIFGQRRRPPPRRPD